MLRRCPARLEKDQLSFLYGRRRSLFIINIVFAGERERSSPQKYVFDGVPKVGRFWKLYRYRRTGPIGKWQFRNVERLGYIAPGKTRIRNDTPEIDLCSTVRGDTCAR